MPVTKQTADELVTKYGWTRNPDGSVSSKLNPDKSTQVIGVTVDVVDVKYNKDKSAARVTYSDGSKASSGMGVYESGTVTNKGLTATDYSNRFQAMTEAEAVARGFKTGKTSGSSYKTTIVDVVSGKAHSTTSNNSAALESLKELNSKPTFGAPLETTVGWNSIKHKYASPSPAPTTDFPTSSPPSGGSGGGGGGGFTPNTQQQPVQSGPSGFVPVQPIPQVVDFQVQQPTYGTQPTTFQTQAGEDGMQTGTFDAPLQTAGLSAVPETVRTKTHYAGTLGLVDPTITAASQGITGSRTVLYGNDFGQTISVTEVNGQPLTYVPPGYTRLQGQAKGGMVKGYAEGGLEGGERDLDAMYRMATRFLGYRGPRSRKSLEDFAKSSPAAASKMRAYTAAMAKGGMVRKGFQEGGVVESQMSAEELAERSRGLIAQAMDPRQAAVALIEPQAEDFIPVDAGQTVPLAPFAEAATVQTSAQAEMPQFMTPATFTAQQAAPQVAAETAQLQAAQGQVSQQAQVQAAQQEGTSVAGVQAAQGTAIMMNNPVQREIQQGELISGAADAVKAAEFTEQIEAAQATPSKQATVAGQLEQLMAQFEGGNTPAWAAGSMRTAMQTLAARGLGASSLAGQAVIQAAMESALPIAQMDAQTQAQFEAQNLSNRQQRAMLAAQQRAQFLGQEFDQAFQSRVFNSTRIGEIANMNFTAEQQIALENSRAANTVNLSNLNNRQAMTMAEAAALANLDMANLNNRQQAAVQNAQNFLQMDLANLNNEQQTSLFKAQQNIQALFTDQAAQNAALQFNAASENQTNQFFSNLSSQVSQFNATQRNAMDQFNVNSVNAIRQFNSEMQQQRDMFNAQNGLVIAQANAQWRQNIATLNTAAINQSNMEFAKTMNALTAANLDQIWQRERDIMSYAFTASESAKDRALNILLADKNLESYRKKMAADEENAKFAVGAKLLFDFD